MRSDIISSVHSTGRAFTTVLRGHPITTDTSETDKGPSPKALMLVSLSGCTGIDVVDILTKMRVSFSDFSIDVEGALTEEDASTYHRVKVIYKIKVKESDRPKVEKAVNLSQDKYCGVAAMFRKFATLEKEIIFL